MVYIPSLTIAFFASAAMASVESAEEHRVSAPRLRNPDASAHHISSISNMFPTYSKFFKSASEDPLQLSALLNEAKNESLETAEKDQFDAVMEAFDALATDFSMSMAPTNLPSVAPAAVAPVDPTPGSPEADPATPGPGPGPFTNFPTSSPVANPVDIDPTDGSPATDPLPEDGPLPSPTEVVPTEAPATAVPVDPSGPDGEGSPDFGTGDTPATPDTPAPVAPTDVTVSSPVAPPTDSPVIISLPTDPPTNAPTAVATLSPTSSPTLANCPGISEEQRVAQILAVLDAVADPVKIRDESLSQGKATTWILSQDEFQICPDNAKLVQRWTMAVLYYSTGGDEWFKCSGNPTVTDNCGNEDPFVSGESRFLSGVGECEWAGITCNSDECVTEIEFEENNLDGTIPGEISLLSELIIWGMERGRLTSTIPTEVGRLTNLIFIDLDYNDLTGTLSSELLGLDKLIQLDLNNNRLSGNLDGIGKYPNMEFLQLHDNLFTGTVPDAVGAYTGLSAFTLHESMITGTMPQTVCDLLASAGNGGSLTSLIADCSLPNPNIVCTCCTDCRSPQL